MNSNSPRWCLHDHSCRLPTGRSRSPWASGRYLQVRPWHHAVAGARVDQAIPPRSVAARQGGIKTAHVSRPYCYPLLFRLCLGAYDCYRRAASACQPPAPCISGSQSVETPGWIGRVVQHRLGGRIESSALRSAAGARVGSIPLGKSEWRCSAAGAPGAHPSAHRSNRS